MVCAQECSSRLMIIHRERERERKKIWPPKDTPVVLCRYKEVKDTNSSKINKCVCVCVCVMYCGRLVSRSYSRLLLVVNSRFGSVDNLAGKGRYKFRTRIIMFIPKCFLLSFVLFCFYCPSLSSPNFWRSRSDR